MHTVRQKATGCRTGKHCDLNTDSQLQTAASVIDGRRWGSCAAKRRTLDCCCCCCWWWWWWRIQAVSSPRKNSCLQTAALLRSAAAEE